LPPNNAAAPLICQGNERQEDKDQKNHSFAVHSPALPYRYHKQHAENTSTVTFQAISFCTGWKISALHGGF
jgi:hypothetical protein